MTYRELRAELLELSVYFAELQQKTTDPSAKNDAFNKALIVRRVGFALQELRNRLDLAEEANKVLSSEVADYERGIIQPAVNEAVKKRLDLYEELIIEGIKRLKEDDYY